MPDPIHASSEPRVVFAVREYCELDFDGTWETLALFSTREKADAFAESKRDERNRNYSYDVDEILIDEEPTR